MCIIFQYSATQINYKSEKSQTPPALSMAIVSIPDFGGAIWKVPDPFLMAIQVDEFYCWHALIKAAP